MTSYILASQSPRRRELLEQHGIEFQVIEPDADAENGPLAGEPAKEFVLRTATQKCENVAVRVDRGVVIGADTVAECDGQIIGKPVDREHAQQILTRLQGTEHFVHTGVCVWLRPSDRRESFVETTRLRMTEMSVQQLQDYLDSNQWVGKAGAFGYQDGIDWVRIISGSESNVVGLPMERLERVLKEISPGQIS